MYKVDNAVIMAAGKSSRFAPLSYERPKALIEVKGEILIERQIRQLRAAGIQEIIIVTGYRSEDFECLVDKFGVKLVKNEDYEHRNNHSSLYVVREHLKNTYICSSDNYFTENPFTSEVVESYYATVYQVGETDEWCPEVDDAGYIDSVTIGGRDVWVMIGHVFFDEAFSEKYVPILEEAYSLPETVDKYWEDLFLEHTDQLKMTLKRYESDIIHEFDSLADLQEFDASYVTDTRSEILKCVASELVCEEREIETIERILNERGNVIGIKFVVRGEPYKYDYAQHQVTPL